MLKHPPIFQVKNNQVLVSEKDGETPAKRLSEGYWDFAAMRLAGRAGRKLRG